jgi:hypothetical protein
MPRDLGPFVRLDYEFLYRRYKNPVVREGRIVDPGVLVEGPVKRTETVGSGSIVTPSGLILTNHHVYRVVLDEQKGRNEAGDLIHVTPTSKEMLVAMLDPQDAMAPPKVKYRARLVAAYPERDVTVLKIAALASGGALPSERHPAVALGNPYGIPLGSQLRILGYPGKGGQTVTPSQTEFAGYARGVAVAQDGSFKTVASVAGGNSGGAALHNQRLVGIPTRVSKKEERGADFGYIHPISWAAQPLAVAALRDREEIPRLERAWLESDHNPDVARTRVFLGGRVKSLMSDKPVPKPEVLIHRADRTLEQITILEREMTLVFIRQLILKFLDSGAPVEDIAAFLGVPVQLVREMAKGPEPALSADAKQVVAGQFFYASNRPGDDGFFILAVPRGQTLKLVVRAPGFRQVIQDRQAGAGIHEDLGAIALAPEIQRPDPMRR